jgi:two-component system CheB/CheR fusion protein
LEPASPEGNPLYVVGIGASAGGLLALQQFFDSMPAESGMCFVIIQHLSADFESQMDELLSRHTTMPVGKVTKTTILKPNHVYLNSSMTQMEVRDGHLFLTPVSADQHVDLPIDVFFRSLAGAAGASAIGVILSGTGTDGSDGIRFIERAGGLVLAQSPESAQFDAMPRSAVDTGACHFVAPPEEMPAILLDHAADPARHPTQTGEALQLTEQETDYREVFNLLQREYNLDFTRYKTGTVGRRITRRMGYRRIREVSAYLKILDSDKQELEDLYHDLLIGVTEFFRDEKPFELLEATIIPALFAGLYPGEDMRAWSAGCASGEEAYSLAILLAERGALLGFTGKISVFATDVHKRSLDAAALGIFPPAALAKVSQARRERFFTELDSGHFKVKNELRRMLTFAHHDLTRDMPFCKLDLICCRNLLIYLQPATQKKVLSLFHFALKMHGVLFLGKSEGIGSLSGEFEAISTQHKMFRKIREQKLALDLDSGRKGNTPVIPRTDLPPAQQRPAGLDRRILSDYDTLLERHMPPGLLVDERFQVIHYFGNVAQFLKPIRGRVETGVLGLAEGNLYLALSTSLQKVKKSGQTVVTRNIRVKGAEEEYLVDVTVDLIPHDGNDTLHYHIFFERIQKEPALPRERHADEESSRFEPGIYYRQHLADLELELQSTRADLLATHDNLQSTSEALHASNEELQAANEELQSTNEELNSANEELHSTNEELYSVNLEYERSNVELKQLNVDLTNLLTSIDSGIIFLDKEMCIRKFNPASSAYFKLLPQDVGRPIDHIAYQLADQGGLSDDIRKVLSDGAVIEKGISTREGAWLLSRIMPFKSEEGAREGVVITFTNISQIKEAELKVSRLNEELARRIKEQEETYLRLEQETGERIRAMEELRQKDRLMLQQSRLAAMGEMLGNIAHQWRQPLNVLGLQVQELRMSHKHGRFTEELLNSTVDKVIEIIQHMSQTIDDFRDFLVLNKERQLFQVDEVIRKSASLIEGSLRDRNIALEITCSGDPRITGRPNEYGQVIINILMNAKDAFGERPKADARITVTSWEEQGKAVVTVTDNAGGIEEEIIGKIFDAYFTTKALGKGTGIGLFMSNTIIGSLGGRISVRNVAGGAEFRIEV